MITLLLYEARSPRTGVPREVEDMPLSSRFTRLKSRLRRKTHPKLSTPYQQIRNEDPKISKASADVCSVVALAMRDVINAQAGASTTAAVVKCTANRISKCLTGFDKCINIMTTNIISHYNLSLRTPELWRIEEIINWLTQRANISASVCIDYAAIFAKTRVKGPQDQANQATETAIINAELDITYAVADAVMAHINTVEPTIESVLFIEKLTSAITTAGSQAARAAADTTTSNNLPPPYTP